jgi:hypothetical protein
MHNPLENRLADRTHRTSAPSDSRALGLRDVHITGKSESTSLAPDYLEEALRLLSHKLSFALNHPLGIAVDFSPHKRLQNFFCENDPLLTTENIRRFHKPVSYSPTVSSIVISLPDYIRVLERFYPSEDTLHAEDELKSLSFYTLNRLEFALHEYGHIVSANRGLSFIGDREELKKLKNAAYHSLRMIPDGYKREESIRLVGEIVSDLKADVVRRDLVLPSDSGRRIDALPVLGIEERVKEEGAMVSPGFSMFRLLRMAAWKPVCIENKRQDLADIVQDEIEYTCESYGKKEFIAVVDEVTRYFISFMQAYSFDCDRFISELTA